MSGGGDALAGEPAALYLDLLKKCLTREIFAEGPSAAAPRAGLRRRLSLWLGRRRDDGADWPAHAETMIGRRRLDHLQHCVADLLERGVPGDFIETGVWRGGAVIFLRALLRVHGDATRNVWVADSFAGVPRPDVDAYPQDRASRLWREGLLRVSRAEVEANFRRYGLLDERVRFLPGWFRDTLPSAPIERLALIRLDGDLYESTALGLRHLYGKLSPGGTVIVDDYGVLGGCRAAVRDFRAAERIDEEIVAVDDSCVFWRKAT